MTVATPADFSGSKNVTRLPPKGGRVSVRTPRTKDWPNGTFVSRFRALPVLVPSVACCLVALMGRPHQFQVGNDQVSKVKAPSVSSKQRKVRRVCRWTKRTDGWTLRFPASAAAVFFFFQQPKKSFQTKICCAVGRINSRSSYELCRMVSVDSGGDVRIYAVSPGGNLRKLTVLSVSGYLEEQVAFGYLLTRQVGGFRPTKGFGHSVRVRGFYGFLQRTKTLVGLPLDRYHVVVITKQNLSGNGCAAEV